MTVLLTLGVYSLLVKVSIIISTLYREAIDNDKRIELSATFIFFFALIVSALKGK
jgi:hypothetical protein